MIFVKSTLAGVAAVIIPALVIYGLAFGVLLILELIPSREGGIEPMTSSGFVEGAYSVGPFPMWPVGVVVLLIFSGGFYWNFRRATRRR